MISRSIKILMVFTFTLFATGCGEDLVDLKPASLLTPENFYQTEEDFESALGNLYAEFQDPFPIPWLDVLAFRGDNLTFTDYLRQASSINVWTNYSMTGMWLDLYQIVSKANIILTKIENVDIANKERVIGEARFFRGWAYFTLVRMFGGVPIYDHEITIEESLNIPRATLAETYAFAENDLLAAAQVLPTKSEWGNANFGRITNHAAYGILGRLYLMTSGATVGQNNWQKAIDAFEKVINSGEYSFATNYADIFSMEGDKGSEAVLTVLFSPIDAGNGGFSQNYVAATFKANNPIALEPGAYESFEDGDIRQGLTFATTYFDATGSVVNDVNLVKYLYGYDPGVNNFSNDWFVLRYTDVLMMYAEAKSEAANSVQQESLDILNMVRNRAGLSTYTTLDIPDMSTFRQTMLAERRSEFMIEGVRWFDLVRSGTAVATLNSLGKNADDTWLLFPIPPQEVTKMPGLLPQNPGY